MSNNAGTSGKKDRLICLWKSPWEGIPSPKFIWAKYVAFYSCSFFYLSYSNHTFQCWTGGFTLMRRKVFSRREDLLGSSHRWMKVWMKIHEVFVHARITVKGGGVVRYSVIFIDMLLKKKIFYVVLKRPLSRWSFKTTNLMEYANIWIPQRTALSNNTILFDIVDGYFYQVLSCTFAITIYFALFC